MRWVGLLVSSLLFTGCGPRAFIEVHVESGLRVPDQIDGLTAALHARDHDNARLEHAFTLDAGDAFPLSFVLEPSDATPHEVELRVIATKADEVVAADAVAFTWEDDRINEVDLEVTP